MKAFVWSVVGALVSAVAIYFLNGYLQNRDKDEKYKVEYSIEDNLVELSKADLVALSQKTGEYSNGLKIARVSIKNIGSEPISSQDATLRISALSVASGGILKAMSEEVPGKDTDGVVLDAQKDRINIKYRLLNPSEEHKFWFAYDAYGEPSLSMRKPGLSLTEKEKDPGSSDWGLGSFLIAAAVLLVVFVIGLIASLASTTSELKVRGYNLDEILKAPKLEDKKDGVEG